MGTHHGGGEVSYRNRCAGLRLRRQTKRRRPFVDAMPILNWGWSPHRHADWTRLAVKHRWMTVHQATVAEAKWFERWPRDLRGGVYAYAYSGNLLAQLFGRQMGKAADMMARSFGTSMYRHGVLS
jgi:hypothetical protein